MQVSVRTAGQIMSNSLSYFVTVGQPDVVTIAPQAARVGDSISLTGTGFGTTRTCARVYNCESIPDQLSDHLVESHQHHLHVVGTNAK